MTPHLTAVVAAYRAGNYLREAIASGLAQIVPDPETFASEAGVDQA